MCVPTDPIVPIANGHYLAMVPGNRRPIDPAMAAHFAKMAPPPPPPPYATTTSHKGTAPRSGEQLLQNQRQLQDMRHHHQEEEEEEEHLRREQQRQLEQQRRDLLQLQLQQQQLEQRQRQQLLQWQLEAEQQLQQQILQQQNRLQQHRSPTSGLCTIYEAMETGEEEEEEEEEEANLNTAAEKAWLLGPPQELDWNQKVDLVQQLINQTLLLSSSGGPGSCCAPPLLLLPVGAGGTLSPLEASVWPALLLPQFSPPDATITSVSCYSPDSQGSASPGGGDWTVVEVETQH